MELTDEAVHYVLRQYFDDVSAEKAANIAHDLRAAPAPVGEPAALTDELQQTVDTLRHALEVIGVGDSRSPQSDAANALVEAGIWTAAPAPVAAPAALTDEQIERAAEAMHTARRVFARKNGASDFDVEFVALSEDIKNVDRSLARAALLAAQPAADAQHQRAQELGFSSVASALDSLERRMGAAEPARADRQEWIGPVVINRTHPNQAYVTYGFSDEAECTQFIKATRYGSHPDRQGVALSDAAQRLVDELHKRHHGRMPYEVQKAFDDVRALLSRASSSRAEVEKNSDRLRHLIENIAFIDRIDLGHRTIYRLHYTEDSSSQCDWYDTPEAAIDAAMLAAAEAPNGEKS